MNLSRVRLLKAGRDTKGAVVYWMSRDQRVHDNWALLYAQLLAVERRTPLAVLFCLAPAFLGATIRQYGFMLKGLREVEAGLQDKAIPFYLLQGNPGNEVVRFVKEFAAGRLITDFDPLNIKKQWKRDVSRGIDIPFFEVDAHNIVPCWVASPKQEYGAYTLRPKIKRLLPIYLDTFPRLKRLNVARESQRSPVDWEKVSLHRAIDNSVPEVNWIRPGERAAGRALDRFIRTGLRRYEKERNDPTSNGQSNLSPYIHFGQLSAQRIALAVMRSSAPALFKEAFLEELIVRRELSDNFCYYNATYNQYDAFPEWARKTLDAHRKDKRVAVYSRAEFEQGKTHDQLWNAAQLEMVKRGKMHGYMRMYWAKKILEWTGSPEEALQYAIYLNDRYEVDGRDPNGYAGIAWSLGGLHDRAWNERPVFGKIRYMSYNGCRSKFNLGRYIDAVKQIPA